MTLSRLGLDLDHIGSASEQGQRLLRSPHGTGKGAWLHNPLDPLTADLDDNAEQTIPELELGRLIDKVTGIKTVDHRNAVLPSRGDSATRHLDERSIAAALMQINLEFAA